MKECVSLGRSEWDERGRESGKGGGSILDFVFVLTVFGAIGKRLQFTSTIQQSAPFTIIRLYDLLVNFQFWPIAQSTVETKNISKMESPPPLSCLIPLSRSSVSRTPRRTVVVVRVCLCLYHGSLFVSVFVFCLYSGSLYVFLFDQQVVILDRHQDLCVNVQFVGHLHFVCGCRSTFSSHGHSIMH
jgi:hypothetical protein